MSIVAKEMHYNIGNVGLGTIFYLVKKLNLNFSNSFFGHVDISLNPTCNQGRRNIVILNPGHSN